MTSNSESPAENRGKLYLEGRPAADGAGFDLQSQTIDGNYPFAAEVLMAAVPLFDQAQCYLEHEPLENPGAAGIRERAGLLSFPN